MKAFNQLWDFFSSVKLAIFTLCTIALTSIIGTIIPQGELPAFYVHQYGVKTAQFMQILDIPEMYYSWWFLGLLGLLCTNLIVCSFERFPSVWKIISADNLSITPERLTKMPNSRKWLLSPPQAEQLQPKLFFQEWGWPVTSSTRSETELFFGQKGRWSRTGVYIVHLSILIVFTGATIGHFWGEKGSVMVPEMTATDKAYRYKDSSAIDLGFEVRCDSFVIEFYDNGMPKEYRSRLTILEDGKETISRDIEVNSPLSYKGFTFYQSSYKGYQDFILTLKDQQTGESETFQLPFQEQLSWQDKQVRFGIVNAEALGQRVVRAKLWLKVGQSPAVIEWLDDNIASELTVAGNRYDVKVKQMYATGLQVAKDPGVWIVYVGCTLMLVGLYMAFFMSHKRIWLCKQVNKEGIALCLAGSSNKNKPAFAQSFKELEEYIEKYLKK